MLCIAACHHITQFHRTPTHNSQCTEVLIHFIHLQNDPILWGCAFWWGDKLPSCLSNTQCLCILSPHNVTFLLLQFEGLLSKVCCHSLSFVTKSAAAVYFLLCRSQKLMRRQKNNYPWIIFVKQFPLSLLAAVAFKSCFPKYTAMSCMYPLPPQNL